MPSRTGAEVRRGGHEAPGPAEPPGVEDPGKREEGARLVRRAVSRLFELGRLEFTPGAIQALAAAGTSPWVLVERHVHGDWGDVTDHEASANVLALVGRQCLMSAYNVGDSLRVWVFTEADRSRTTVMLPEDYDGPADREDWTCTTW